jgi:sensor histidine kinase YesM
VEDAYHQDYQTRGRIAVTIKNLGSPDSLEISVADNGIGFDRAQHLAHQNGGRRVSHTE